MYIYRYEYISTRFLCGFHIYIHICIYIDTNIYQLDFFLGFISIYIYVYIEIRIYINSIFVWVSYLHT